MSILPADYPPPFEPSDCIVPPAAAEDERIDVGVLIVGAGPAGLATAVRLGQLLGDDPALAEQLGEVPIAVADKGKGPGSHLLSGAVMKPGPIKELFPDVAPSDIPHYWEVDKDLVYLMRPKSKIRIPVPPQLKNHGNWVISVSQLARWMSEQAEELGAFMLPETDAQKLLIERNRVRGVLTGDKGRGKEGEQLGAFEPGAEVHAKVTVLAEGTPGHLASVARHYYDLDRDSTRTWELGVKEVWRVPKPLTSLIHTLGWPLRFRTKYREYGGSWMYPMGDDMISLGFVIGLDYADASLSIHDVLQQFKTHPFIREILDDGERVAWGAKTIPGGGLWGLPSRMHVPGAVLVGDSAGFVDMAALKGVNYAIRSGMIAAESIYQALKEERAEEVGGLWGYTKAIQDSEVWKDLWKSRNIRPAFQKGFIYGGMVHGMATASFGRLPRKRVRAKADADEHIFIGDASKNYPAPDGQYLFDKLSSVFASGNATRDDQPSHIRVQTEVPKTLAVAWESMCPAKVYEVQEGSETNGTVTVHVNASNCVQCGAITAKGGRLTPPEGGSGPEYTIT